MRRTRRALTMLILWGALVFGGALVGSLAAGGSSLATVSSVRFSTSGTLAFPGKSSVPIQVTATGGLDFAADTASVTLHVPGNLAVTFPGGSDKPMTIKLLMVKAVVYISYPGLDSATGGKAWIAIKEGTPASEATLYELLAEYFGEFGAEVRTYPSSDVHKLGTSVVDGVKATGWLFDYPETVAAQSRKSWYWIDERNQLVQVKVTTAPPKGVPTDGISNFFDYDVPTVIAAPAASAVKVESSSVLEKYLTTIDGVIGLVF